MIWNLKVRLLAMTIACRIAARFNSHSITQEAQRRFWACFVRDFSQTATSDKRSDSRPNPLPWRRNVEGILGGILYKITLDLDIVFGRLSEEISQVQTSLPKIIMKVCALQWNACTFAPPSPQLQCWAQNQIPTCEINSWKWQGPVNPWQEDETLQHWNWGEGEVDASMLSLFLLAKFLPTTVQISIAISQPYLVCPPHKTAMPLDCMLVISCWNFAIREAKLCIPKRR